jgi:hypothetical protein
MLQAFRRSGVWSSARATIVLAGLASPAVAGTINFSGDLAGAAPLLTTITTPNLIASGTAIPETFSASAAGVGSVMGTLLLSDVGNPPSITITSLTITLAPSTSGNSMGFGFTVIQDFAYSGAPTVNALVMLSGTGTFTGLNQILSFGESSSVRGGPFPNSFVSLTPTLGGGSSSFSTDVFPVTKPLTPGGVGRAAGIPATGPVTEILALSTILINTAASAGSTINITPGSGLIAGSSVPEPSGLILMGLGRSRVAIRWMCGAKRRLGPARRRRRAIADAPPQTS